MLSLVQYAQCKKSYVGKVAKETAEMMRETADVVAALSVAIRSIEEITPSTWRGAVDAAGKKIPETMKLYGFYVSFSQR